MKKEIEKSKGVKNLGPLTLELAKKLSEQLDKDSSQPADFSKLNGVHETSMHHHVSDLKLSDGMETKVVKLPNLNTLSLSLKEIKSLSDEELLKLLSNEGHGGHMLDRTVQLINNEILIRQIRESSKPNWAVKPTFLLLIITLILTAIPAAETLYNLTFKDARSIDSHTNKGEKIKTNDEP